MSSGALNLKGSLEVTSDGCGPCGSGDRTTIALALACAGRFFQSIVSTPKPIVIATIGIPGAVFVDVDVLDQLAAIEFLYARMDSGQLVLRIDAEEAILEPTGGTFPTGFVGGETLTFDLDGVAVSVAFLVGDQTAAQVATRINGALALLDIATPRADVSPTTGKLRIRGILTGPQGSLIVTGGSGAATLGLTGLEDTGAGADVPISGTFLAEFWRSDGSPAVPGTRTPRRIQVSGSGTVTLLAAGRTT